ncbi:MAG: glutamate 5-kinase, partial [Alistipes sp.]|nr:glutamate 5-kinase [Alistipes sp.]
TTDTAASLRAAELKADAVFKGTTVDGVFSADPRKDPNARLIPDVYALSDDIMALAGDAGSALGTGGMRTKLFAARLCTENGTDMVIANGEHPEVLYDICDGKSVGTRFVGKKVRA